MALPVYIIAFGRKSEILTGEVLHYARLLQPFAAAHIDILKAPAGRKSQRNGQQARELEMLKSRWPKRGYIVALSEEGRLRDSMAFSRWIDRRTQAAMPLVFTLGSAHGLAAPVKNACHEVISLSPMTLSHGIALLVLVEQLYRAFTILHNHPYHKQ